MKRRILAMALCLMLICCTGAAAEPVTPMDEMFMRAKEALLLMSMGDVDQAVELLDFAFDVESGLTEDSFREFAAEGLTLLDSGMVQVEVALCWLDDMGVWHIGIPLVEPVSWDVEALVLDTRDMMVFSSYSVSNWGALEEAAAISQEAHWNLEYQAGATVLFADE